MRGGFKLLPETIESALLTHEAICAAAVTGITDERLGQVPVAAIQLKPDAPAPSIAELEAHLRDRVLATHIPVSWRFVQCLPRTPSLKVDRPALRQLFADLSRDKR
jgi:acyl-coenzyme A synthetase/AMP-(fatty) acid ligase